MTTSSNESSPSSPDPQTPGDSPTPVPGQFEAQITSHERADHHPAGDHSAGGPALTGSAGDFPSNLTNAPNSGTQSPRGLAAYGSQSQQPEMASRRVEHARQPMMTADPSGLSAMDLQRRLERIHAAQYVAYKRSQLRKSVILFLLTFLSTFLVGANYLPIEYLLTKISPQYEKYLQATIGKANLHSMFDDAFRRGYGYSVPLMLILFCHEMGHYLQSVKNRVPASLPYFIPMPLPPMGTMGAVIFQGRGAASRKQMFDIAVSGPLAGLLITIPVLWYGLQESKFGPRLANIGLEFGEPLLLQWMIHWIHGPTPEGQVVMLSSMGFAGWVGVLITAMNLLPVGQLDGGHILYTLIGRRAHFVAYGVIGLGVLFMAKTQNYSFSLLLLLLLMTGPKHPPTSNDQEPLGLMRHLIGWLTMSFLLIGFTPEPIIVPDTGAPQKAAPAAKPAVQPEELAVNSLLKNPDTHAFR